MNEHLAPSETANIAETVKRAADMIGDAISLLVDAERDLRTVKGQPMIGEIQSVIFRLTGQGDPGICDDAAMLEHAAGVIYRRGIQ